MSVTHIPLHSQFCGELDVAVFDANTDTERFRIYNGEFYARGERIDVKEGEVVLWTESGDIATTVSMESGLRRRFAVELSRVSSYIAD
jgi:hypothetical protein